MKKTFFFLGVMVLGLSVCGCGKGPSERGHKTILVLGDSLTGGYGVEPSRAYPAQLERLIREKGYPGVTIVGEGVSGATTESGMARLVSHLSPRPQHGPPLPYDVLVLALGSNDGLRGLEIGAIRARLLEMIRYAQGKGLQVVLCGMRVPPHRGLSYMGEFEGIYKSLSRETGVPLVPFLLEGVAARPSLNVDGMHPNAAGHKMLAETVFKTLKRLL